MHANQASCSTLTCSRRCDGTCLSNHDNRKIIYDHAAGVWMWFGAPCLHLLIKLKEVDMKGLTVCCWQRKFPTFLRTLFLFRFRSWGERKGRKEAKKWVAIHTFEKIIIQVIGFGVSCDVGYKEPAIFVHQTGFVHVSLFLLCLHLLAHFSPLPALASKKKCNVFSDWHDFCAFDGVIRWKVVGSHNFSSFFFV